MVNWILNLLKMAVLLTVIGLTGCKSDVSDKTEQAATSVLNVDTLTVQNIQNIRETNSLSSVVTKKYYSLRACLSENSLGQKLDRRNVVVVGTPLKSNMTDPSGCIFWDHTFELDYSGQNNCRILSQKIRIPGANIEKVLNYSVDILNDQVDDLSRSKGCTILKEEKVEASLKNSGGELILEKVNLFWTGEQEEKRSDVKYLSYRSKIESCLKSRVNNLALANTSIKITLSDFGGIHEPIVMENVLTNEAGCFSRQFESPYEQFKYSHWLEKNLEIEITSGPLQAQRTQTQIFMNPYEPSRAFFGIDARWDTPLNNPIKKNNRIHVDGVMYIQIGNDIENFKVNDYLGLTVSKSYQIVLNPRLDLGHRFTRDKPRYVKMHDGRFRLKFMILAPDRPEIEISPENFQNFTYITGAEKIVTLKDGVINSLINIPVKLTDLPRLATRTVSVFKLEPIDDIGLRDTVVTGFFKAKIAWIKTNVIQDDVLQTTSDELESRYTEKDHQGLVDQVRTQISEKKADIMSELFIPEKGNLFNSETELLVEDIKRAEYKKYIENLFNNINQFEEKEIFGNPKIFVSDDPKSIFKEHLKKTLPNIEFADVAKEDDSSSANTNQSSALPALPSGLISDLYEKAKGGVLSLEDNRFKAFMTVLCREAFPAPKASESFLGRMLGPGEDPEFKLCKANPKRYFSIDPIMHAKQIRKTNPLYSNGFNMNVSSSFRTSYGEAETEYLSKRVGADAGFKLPLGEYFGMGLKLFDVSYTWSESESKNQYQSDDLSASKNLIIEKFVVEVEGDFEKCLLVQGKDYTPIMSINPGTTGILVPRQMSQFNEKVEKSFYVCDSLEKQKVLEPWYYIQAYVPSATLLRDPYGPTEIKLIKVLRGESSFKEFKMIFEDETKVYLAQRTNNTETPDEKIYQNWGHLLRNTPTPSVANKLLIKNFEGSFPGTIQ
jgi:hypothetical protein